MTCVLIWCLICNVLATGKLLQKSMVAVAEALPKRPLLGWWSSPVKLLPSLKEVVDNHTLLLNNRKYWHVQTTQSTWRQSTIAIIHSIF